MMDVIEYRQGVNGFDLKEKKRKKKNRLRKLET